MAQHIELGKRGELIAADYLRKKGYRIIGQNWKYGNFELDIIACNTTDLVFVEVKTRSDDTFYSPEDAVNWQKQRHITIAANYYYQKLNMNLEPRFDVISIVLNDNRCEINHIEDAFPPRGPRKRY